MKKGLKIFVITLSSILGVLLLLMGCAILFLGSGRLTPIVNKYSSEFINGKIEFSSVKLNFFSEFPLTSLYLKDGRIISHALKDDTTAVQGADSLLVFNEFVVSINPFKAIFGKIDIKRISLEQPQIFGYISPKGNANWDIIQSSDTTSTESAALDLNIAHISIQQGAKVIFRSDKDSLLSEVNFNALSIDGNLTDNMPKLRIDHIALHSAELNGSLTKEEFTTSWTIDSLVLDREASVDNVAFSSNISARNRDVVLLNNQPISINGNYNYNDQTFNLDNLRFVVTQIPFVVNGYVRLEDQKIMSDLDVSSTDLEVKKFLELIPKEYSSSELRKLNTSIITNLSLKLKGEYAFNGSQFPSVVLNVEVPKGSVSYVGAPSKIDRVKFDATLSYDHQNPQNTSFDIHSLLVDGGGISLNGWIKGSKILTDPTVNLDITGKVDIAQSLKLLPKEFGYRGLGDLEIRAKGVFRPKDMNVKRVGNTALDLEIRTKLMRVRSPRDSISMMAQNTMFSLSTSQTRVGRNGKKYKFLGLNLESDTTRIRYKRGMLLTLAGTKFALSGTPSSLTKDTSKVNALRGLLESTNIEFNDADSSRYRVKDITLKFNQISSSKRSRSNVMRLNVAAGIISATTNGNRGFVRNSSFNMQVEKNRSTTRNSRREKALDSLQRVYPQIPRDSLFRYLRSRSKAEQDAFKGSDINMKVDGYIAKIIRQWSARGDIKAELGRISTPYFPIRNSFKNLDITLSTDSVECRSLNIHSGDSQLSFTGTISGIRRALTSSRGLGISAAIKSDSLNLNQLLTALGSGISYMNSSQEAKQKIIESSDDNELEKNIEALNNESNISQLLVIPSNIRADISLDVKRATYSNINIDRLHGALIMRNRVLQLKELSINSSAGEIDLSALYATYTPSDLQVGLDMEFKDVQVEQLIGIIPEVDTYLPMLSSFKGVVNCALAVTASVDTMMNVVLPSVNAALQIKGENMVLMDGQTFSKIAKTLMFKNKRENLVENISVQMIARNNKVEIFPFVMEIDRYRVGIGGTQNLDMSYKYHISILKSPMPFKFGVNISGTDFDHMRFGVGKAKYKSDNMPVVTDMVDSIRINLRTTFNQMIFRGINQARLSSTISVKVPTVDTDSLEVLSATDSLNLAREGVLEIDTTKLNLPEEIPLTKREQRRAKRRK